MHYEDLTPYEYQGYIDDKHLNVGWLGDDPKRVPVSTSPATFCRKLRYACGKTNLLRNRCMGVHVCPFCGEYKGNGEVWVRGDNGIVYIAPQMIGHYVEAHGYSPPQEFKHAFNKNGVYIESKTVGDLKHMLNAFDDDLEVYVCDEIEGNDSLFVGIEKIKNNSEDIIRIRW